MSGPITKKIIDGQEVYDISVRRAGARQVYIGDELRVAGDVKTSLRITDGSVENPSICFTSEPDSGLYKDDTGIHISQAGRDIITIGGTSALTVENYDASAIRTGSNALRCDGKSPITQYHDGADTTAINFMNSAGTKSWGSLGYIASSGDGELLLNSSLGKYHVNARPNHPRGGQIHFRKPADGTAYGSITCDTTGPGSIVISSVSHVVRFPDIPGSPAGLPSGSLWYDPAADNVLKYVP